MSQDPQRSAPPARHTDPGRARAFLQRWRTDIAPVHERTERSREIRVQFFQLALKFLFVLNAGALVALPWTAKLVGARLADGIALFLRAEGRFLVGLVLVTTATLFQWITLDADVIRQKGERSAARRRLREAGFDEQFPDSLESERVQSEGHQRKYWRIGVGLMWTSVVMLVLATVAFVSGVLLAGQLLTSTLR